MSNPILDEISSFFYDPEMQVWESMYRFVPFPNLEAYLRGLPEGRAVYFDRKSQPPNIVLPDIDERIPGVRVKVAERYVYLALGLTTPEALNPIFSIHNRLLHYRLYYPDEADLLAYWQKPDDHFNNALDYQYPMARSSFLASLIREHCPDVKSVLEIGCNIGRNIAFLSPEYQVAGVEISENAVKLLRTTYSQLADSTVHVGDARTVLEALPDNSVDLVFSMAVLMHLHPTMPQTFWRDIVRVSRKYVITIENESTSSDRNWARDYSECFEPYGANCIHMSLQQNDDNLLHGYISRVFDCREKTL